MTHSLNQSTHSNTKSINSLNNPHLYLSLQEETTKAAEAPPAEEAKKEEAPSKTEETTEKKPSVAEGETTTVEAKTDAAAEPEEAGKTTEDAAVAESSAAAPSDGDNNANDDGKNRRVFVGNLAWEVSWQDLKDLMKSAGHDVTRSDIMQTHDGRSRGCGIVEFATVEGAKQAVLTLNDTELMGRQIFVREDREDKGHVGGGGSAVGGSGGGGGTPNGGSAAGSSGGGARFFSGEQNQSRRVYVGNLSWDVAWPELKDHMRQAGEVLHSEVICEHNGRSKGCGIVEYATEEEAQEAISTLTQTELNGRMIFVREDRENSSAGGPGGAAAGGGARGPSNVTSVYVWNLSYETTWQELKDHMRKAGNVDQATILTESHGKSIGCGTVVYQKAQDAARAIRELQDSELQGRPMRLREDRVQPGGGGGGGGGRGGHHGGRSGGRGGFGGRGGVGGRGGGGRHNNTGSHFQSKSEAGSQLFIGNLSFDTTWKELKDHFKQCGEVERADVKKHPDGRSRGFGIVRFLKASDAEGAIATLSGSDLQGRDIEVRIDAPRQNKPH
jgi:RNA recognition motif-containing protein